MLQRLTGTTPCPCCAYAQASSILPFSLSQVIGGVERAPHRGEAVAIDPPLSRELALDGATVVDPATGNMMHGMTVLMKMGRILDVFPTDSRDPDPAIERIDLTGRYIVPGYNDMHSHVLELADPAGALALMLAEGVTGFRQMSGSPQLLAKRRAGRLRFGGQAPALHETPGAILTPFNSGSAEAVAEEIGRQKAQGADFIKMGLVSADVFYAAITEAKRIGIPILGHLQEGTDAVEATAAGFRSIEHLGPGSTMWAACSTEQERMRADAYRRPFIKPPPFRIPFLERIVMARLRKLLVNPAAFADPADVARIQVGIDSFSEGKAQDVAGRFAEDGSWQVPTLVRLRTQEFAENAEYETDEGLDYMPRANIKTWREVTDRFRRLPVETRRTFRDAYPRQRALAKLFADAGVRMMTGTDGGALMGPGLTLRQEFAELGAEGVTPLKILQMTTSNVADYLHRRETMGRIASGCDADLVILDADPLERVENLHRISGVVRAGFHHSRAQLDALKAKVAAGRGYLSNRD